MAFRRKAFPGRGQKGKILKHIFTAEVFILPEWQRRLDWLEWTDPGEGCQEIIIQGKKVKVVRVMKGIAEGQLIEGSYNII